MADPVDAHHFRVHVSDQLEHCEDRDALEHHYVLRRINSPTRGVRRALLRALGERHDYVLAYQQLNYALSLCVNGSEYGAQQVAVAIETLRRSAPIYDRSLFATGAPLSFVVTSVAGWWHGRADGRALSSESDPWRESHAAARADLLAVLGGGDASA